MPLWAVTASNFMAQFFFFVAFIVMSYVAFYPPVSWGAVPGGRSLGKCEATLPPAAHTPSAVAGLVTAHGRSVAEHNHGFKKLGDKAWRRRAVLTTGRNGITGGDRSE